MKILSIVGARPQFIKAVIVSKKIREKGIKEILLHTGQHYDFNMSEVFFNELELPKPNYNLGIGSGSHGEQTGKMLMEIEKVLLKENPDFVLVYGDTNSTLAGALAAAKLHIQVAHVEAGLRSFNKRMPEEINRVLTDHISDLLFAPTEFAVKNLKNEGITKEVYNVGDVMFDIALEVSKNVDEETVLSKFSLIPKGYILATVHRASNTDIKKNLQSIFAAFGEIAKYCKIFFPMHPRTRKALSKFKLQDVSSDKLIISNPVSYKEMIALEKNAKLVITDSGGVQKEAYFFKVPCITVRDETEWVELVNAGWNKLTGTDRGKIVSETLHILENKRILKWTDFYGNGKASDRMLSVLMDNGGLDKRRITKKYVGGEFL